MSFNPTPNISQAFTQKQNLNKTLYLKTINEVRKRAISHGPLLTPKPFKNVNDSAECWWYDWYIKHWQSQTHHNVVYRGSQLTCTIITLLLLVVFYPYLLEMDLNEQSNIFKWERLLTCVADACLILQLLIRALNDQKFPSLWCFWDVLDLIAVHCIVLQEIQLSKNLDWVSKSIRSLNSIRTINWLAGNPPWFYLTIKGLNKSISQLIDVYLSFFAMLLTISAIMFVAFSEDIPIFYGSIWNSMFTLMKLASFEDVWIIFAGFEVTPYISNTVRESGYAFLAFALTILGWTMTGIVANCAQEHFLDISDERKYLLMERMGKDSYGISMKQSSKSWLNQEKSYDRIIIGYDTKPGLNLFFKFRGKLEHNTKHPEDFIEPMYHTLSHDRIPNHYKHPPTLVKFQPKPSKHKEYLTIIDVIFEEMTKTKLNNIQCLNSIDKLVSKTLNYNFPEMINKNAVRDQAFKKHFLLKLYEYISHLKSPGAKQLHNILVDPILHLKNTEFGIHLTKAIQLVLQRFAIYKVVCEEIEMNSSERDPKYYIDKRNVLIKRLLSFQTSTIEKKAPKCRSVKRKIIQPD